MNKKLQTKFSTRQFMQTKDFEIYYYNDQNLSSIENHSHTYYEYYLFLEGDVAMEIDGHLYPLKYGDIILIPPGILHRAIIYGSKVPYRRFVFWVSTNYFNQIAGFSESYTYLVHRAENEKEYIFHNDMITFYSIQTKVFHLIEETHSQHFGKVEKTELCVRDLIIHLNRIIYEKEHPKNEKGEQNLYHNLISYIEEHLDEDLALDKMAKHFFVSKYHIAHVFKDNIGCSIHQYITKKRLEACKNALSGDVKIGSVYLMYGFKDYSSFYRAFKKEYGLSPKDYQRRKPKL